MELNVGIVTMIIKPKFLLQLLLFAPECTPMILLEGENSPLERG